MILQVCQHKTLFVYLIAILFCANVPQKMISDYRGLLLIRSNLGKITKFKKVFTIGVGVFLNKTFFALKFVAWMLLKVFFYSHKNVLQSITLYATAWTFASNWCQIHVGWRGFKNVKIGFSLKFTQHASSRREFNCFSDFHYIIMSADWNHWWNNFIVIMIQTSISLCTLPN